VLRSTLPLREYSRRFLERIPRALAILPCVTLGGVELQARKSDAHMMRVDAAIDAKTYHEAQTTPFAPAAEAP
jgi:hypothetical protein